MAAAVARLDQAVARVEQRAAEFFDALAVSGSNASQLGKALLAEIDDLDVLLGACGARGMSLLVGSKEMSNETAVKEKLEGLADLVRRKEAERTQLKDNTDMLIQLLRSSSSSNSNSSASAIGKAAGAPTAP